MNIKQFIWVAFCSVSAILVISLLMTGFRPLLAKPGFLGIVVFFVIIMVATIYYYLGRQIQGEAQVVR
mgnify:CR=1 FL=1